MAVFLSPHFSALWRFALCLASFVSAVTSSGQKTTNRKWKVCALPALTMNPKITRKKTKTATSTSMTRKTTTSTTRSPKATPMAAGHNSPQESAPKNPNVSRAEPCPRRSVAPATPNTTASQRFLHRFGAGDTLQAATPRPRAMKNPHPQPLQHLLMELQGDLFSDSATTTTTTGNAHGTRKNQPAAHAATGPARYPAAAQAPTQHTGGGQQ